jgi:DNA-binding response OmpR family regulator
MRVLVVEDDPVIRFVVNHALTDAGFDVIEAATGTEAVRLMVEQDQIDLVVTDLHLPGADGFEVAAYARAHNPGVPVLFISAHGYLLSALPIPPPCSRLPKPFSMDALGLAVSGLLGHV